MKVVFLINNLSSGGAERTTAYLSKYFVNKGIECTIILYGLKNKIFYDLDNRVKIIQVLQSNKVTNKIQRIRNIIYRYILVRQHVKREKPDILFSTIYASLKYLFFMKNKFKIIVSERNYPGIVTDKREIKLREKIFKKADGIIFQTKRARDFFSNEIAKKSVVIPNALGNPYISNVPEITERKNVIAAIGRLTEQKDYPTMFKAFAIVTDKHPDYKLKIFGKGELKDNLVKLSQKLGISDKIIFAGTAPDAIVQIADSKCFVMSSIFEGMPNALMEAMAVGLPCVSTDCPNGPAELIQNGKNGLLVPVGDADALANAILKMIEDTDFAEQCGKNASKIKKTHSIENNAKKYLEFILKMNREKNV